MTARPTVCQVHYKVPGSVYDSFHRASKQSSASSLDPCRTAFRYSTNVGVDVSQLPALYQYDIPTSSANSLEHREAVEQTLIVDRSHTARDRRMPTENSRTSRLPCKSKTALSSSTLADLRHRCASACVCPSGCVRYGNTPVASTPLTGRPRPRTAAHSGHVTLKTSGQNADWPWIVEYRCPEHPYRIIGDKRISQVRWDDLSNAWIAVSENPACGWYLKFVKGLPLDDRSLSDLTRTYSDHPSRRFKSGLSNRDDGYSSAGSLSASSRRRGRGRRSHTTATSSYTTIQQLGRNTSSCSTRPNTAMSNQGEDSGLGADTSFSTAADPDTVTRVTSGSATSETAADEALTNVDRNGHQVPSKVMTSSNDSAPCSSGHQVATKVTSLDVSVSRRNSKQVASDVTSSNVSVSCRNSEQVASEMTSSNDSAPAPYIEQLYPADFNNNNNNNNDENNFQQQSSDSSETNNLGDENADTRRRRSEIKMKERKPFTRKSTDKSIAQDVRGSHRQNREWMFGDEDFSTKLDGTAQQDHSDQSDEDLSDSHDDFNVTSRKHVTVA